MNKFSVHECKLMGCMFSKRIYLLKVYEVKLLSFLIHKKAKGWLENNFIFKVEHGFLDKFQAILNK